MLEGYSDNTDLADLAYMSMGLSISEKIVQICGGDSIEFYDAGHKKGSTLMFSMAMKAVSNEENMNNSRDEENNSFNRASSIPNEQSFVED